MDSIVKTVTELNAAVYAVVGGPVMVVLLTLVGIYFTFRLGFFQIAKIGHWLKSTIGSLLTKREQKTTKGAVSPFQALSAALAGTAGVGNIAGVATAIVLGGPGAVFWMWVSAFFGMMTKYSEVVLSLHFRKRNKHGDFVGGPMYYIERGLNMKWLAVIFAILTIIATFGIGNMSQVNSVAQAMHSTFGVPKIVSGVLLAVFAALVILGGIKRIVGVTEILVPFMCLIYILGGLVIIVIRADALPGAFASIFQGAFSLQSVGGGVLGYAFVAAMRFGIARGVFTNEAGLGSAPIVHAAADVDHPVKQGMWGIFEVFADTIVVCTISALVILQSGLVGTPDAADPAGGPLTGAALSARAFDSVIPGFGEIFITLAVLLFAGATLLGWSYYGEKSLEYLSRGSSTVPIYVYRVIFILVVVLGAVMQLDLVWALSDTFNTLMAIPNLFALICMSGLVVKLTKEYKINNK